MKKPMTKMKMTLWAPDPQVSCLPMGPMLPIPPWATAPPPVPLGVHPLISTFGNLLRNCLTIHNILGAFTGLIGIRVFSKLLIQYELLNYGAKEKTVLLWILTNYQDLWGSTTKRELWRKPVGLKGSSTNSAPRTISKKIFFCLPF